MSYTVYLPVAVSDKNFEGTVFDLINEQRAIAGVPVLHVNEDLSEIARFHAEDMRDRGYLDHDSPEETWIERISSVYPDYLTIGENIAAGYPDPDSAVLAWMESGGHKENILNFWFAEIGIGYAFGGAYRHYWVVDFGTKRG